MNWKYLRPAPWLDTRARFVASIARNGCLLDVGSSDGATLNHMAELRPDLRLFATDIEGHPERYPAGCEFHRGDLQTTRLPWADASFNAITCMHLVEHLEDFEPLIREVGRLLKPGGAIYFETPHPKTLTLASPEEGAGEFTLNFYDDGTHVRLVTTEMLGRACHAAGLEVARAGTSRNLLFAAAHLGFALMPPSRKKHTAFIHWIGWSAYLIARKPK